MRHVSLFEFLMVHPLGIFVFHACRGPLTPMELFFLPHIVVWGSCFFCCTSSLLLRLPPSAGVGCTPWRRLGTGADLVAGTALCEPPCADFVAGTALCEPSWRQAQHFAACPGVGCTLWRRLDTWRRLAQHFAACRMYALASAGHRRRSRGRHSAL